MFKNVMIVGLSLAAVANPGVARAACMKFDVLPKANVKVTPAVLPIANSAFSAPTSLDLAYGRGEHSAIVGLWTFEMLTKSTNTNTNPMPDGTLFDFGTAAWHGDGTELMNSGNRNPRDGDFCQGVWTQVDASTFSLFHLPLAWANDAYLGPVVLRARVTVDSTGQHYTGTFIATQYLAAASEGHEFDQTMPLGTITGTITATRITVD